MKRHNSKILAQGAEAVITLQNGSIIKNRIRKDYRLEIIDECLRTKRTRAEAKILTKLSAAKIPVPKILETEKTKLTMEFIEGAVVKEVLDKNVTLAKQIGKTVAKMHDLNIVHHDLTTSNMILRNKEIVLIDFGLSFHSLRYEDKAVDVHLFKQALESKHYKVSEMAMKEFWKGYQPKDLAQVKARFEEVELRGRNKAKY